MTDTQENTGTLNERVTPEILLTTSDSSPVVKHGDDSPTRDCGGEKPSSRPPSRGPRSPRASYSNDDVLSSMQRSRSGSFSKSPKLHFDASQKKSIKGTATEAAEGAKGRSQSLFTVGGKNKLWKNLKLKSHFHFVTSRRFFHSAFLQHFADIFAIVSFVIYLGCNLSEIFEVLAHLQFSSVFCFVVTFD